MITDYLNGDVINAPVGWEDQTVLVNFNESEAQGSISEKTLTFVNQAAIKIITYINEGLVGGLGITEGMIYKRDVSKNGETKNVFTGFLDFSEFYKQISPVQVEVAISELDSKATLDKLLDGISLAALVKRKLIKKSDLSEVEYVVQKPFDPIQTLALAISIFVIFDKLASIAKELAKDKVEQSADVADAAAVPLLVVGVGIKGVGWAIIRLIYFAIIAALLKTMIDNMINIVYPITRTYHGLKPKFIIETALAEQGYTLVTNIKELDKLVWLPSTNPIGTDPFTARDYGYTVDEQFSSLLQGFRAEVVVQGNLVYLYPKIDSFWEKNASFQLPNILNEEVRYNTNELFNTHLIHFSADSSDDWTLEHDAAAAYEVRTFQKSTSESKAVGIRGLKEVKMQVALAERKGDKFTAAEELVLVIAKGVDALLSVFGAKVGAASRIKARSGLMVISGESFNVPKWVYISGKRIPSNHHNFLSAEALYTKYHVVDSLVQREGYEQKKFLPANWKIPFTFDDYKKVLDNSNCTTHDGRRAKIESLKWKIGEDTAEVNGYIREVYTTNLKEEVTREP